MSTILNFASNHPILTVILLLIIGGILIDVVKVLKKGA